MKANKRIRTVLYGDQQVTSGELELLHTPSFQRLYDLHQLGFTDRVYIDASHSRLHHVVGVVEQADRIITALVRNLREQVERPELRFGPPDASRSISPLELADYTESRRAEARYMGLLHDLTHAPYGHTLEDEIHLIQSKHDSPDRQADAFYRLLCQLIGYRLRDSQLSVRDAASEAMPPRSRTGRVSVKDCLLPDGATAVSLDAYLDAHDLYEPPRDCSEIAKIASRLCEDEHHSAASGDGVLLSTMLRHLYFAMTALLHLELLHKKKIALEQLPRIEYRFQRLIEECLKAIGKPLQPRDRFNPHQDAFLLDVIGNTICADLLDYAKRDAFYCDLKLAFDVDRTIENFTLVSCSSGSRDLPPNEGKYPKSDPFYGQTIRTAISLFGQKLRTDVPGQLMGLLQARFHIYERALFHPTKAVAGAMLGSALQLLGWQALPSHFRHIGDTVFLHQVSEAARLARDLIRGALRANSSSSPEEVRAYCELQMSELPVVGVLVAAQQLLDSRLTADANSGVEDVLIDIDAALEIIDRLVARRYYKPVFRLLPNANLGKAEIDHEGFKDCGSAAEVIARIFLDAKKRKSAERLIESRANLPRGAVVIHCPPYRGPIKIANILLVDPSWNFEKTQPLRNIGSLADGMFTAHESAVTSLEQMYASMWRLVVCFAPPHHLDYSKCEGIISKVISEVLTTGAPRPFFPPLEVVNDPSLQRELAYRRRGREVAQPIDVEGGGDTGAVELFEVTSGAAGVTESRKVPLESAFTVAELVRLLSAHRPAQPRALRADVLPAFVVKANTLNLDARKRLRLSVERRFMVDSSDEGEKDRRIPIARVKQLLWELLREAEGS